MTRAAAVWLTLFLSIWVSGCYRGEEPEAVFNDFESDSDLNRIHWSCGRLFFISENHATHGNSSLLMELYPGKYPGLTLKLPKRDGTPYEGICLDFFNPQEEELEIVVRIDDREDTPAFEDRYNRAFTLAPGKNSLCIPVKHMATSGSGRPLNADAISRFMFFLVDTTKIYRLYVDYIRLEKKCDRRFMQIGRSFSAAD